MDWLKGATRYCHYENIANRLRYTIPGTPLYSIVHGNVIFKRIEGKPSEYTPNFTYWTIIVEDSTGIERIYDSYGCWVSVSGECMLYPDKKLNWNNY